MKKTNAEYPILLKDGAMKLIIGIGNGGAAYENTYHNAGIVALRKIAEEAAGGEKFKKHSDLFRYLKKNGFVFVESMVFMNESGLVVAESKKKFGVKDEDMLVIHDDSDIGLGKFKLSFDRSSAGHKGVESIIRRIRTKKFWRLRLGIRSHGSKAKAETFVLNKIKGADHKKIDFVAGEITKIIFPKEPAIDSGGR
ncbi:MAG: aminoacyl-tRNA hydrolase [Patescibacteria group bacterium]